MNNRFIGENINDIIIEGDKVNKEDACPDCGERRREHLRLAEDKVAVDCSTCGCVFIPGEIKINKRACPQCGENDKDKLHLAKDSISVDCSSCGCVFIPEDKG